MSGDNVPQNYASVDEIFGTLSIAEIKTLEIDLRSQAASKRSELRLLVGESYRDLLTTADTIVEMREQIIILRRQLSVLMSTCDSQTISRSLSNLSLLPATHESAKQKVILSYLADLRALVIHFIKRSETITAARLYSLGRILFKSMKEDRPELSRRLKSIRQILIKAINKCDNIHDFACAFAMLESATAQSCLTYFLSLQIAKLHSCNTLQSLASTLLHVMDATRDFSRLSDVFDRLSKQTLLSSVAQLPELDAAILAECMTDELQHYKPFLRSDVLDSSSIEDQVDEWLRRSAAPIQELAARIIADETDIAAIIKTAKNVRDSLDEASKLSIYEFLSPAVDAHIVSILKSSLEAISDSTESLLMVIDSVQGPRNLWDNKIPWLKGSVQNFTQVTKRAMGGHSHQFSAFEKIYLSAIDQVEANLKVLGRVNEYSTRRESYRAEVIASIDAIQAQLHKEAEQTSDRDKTIAILRLLRFIRKTAPVPISASSLAPYFRKLLPSIVFELNDRDLSGIYEDGYPRTISPKVAAFLYTYSHSISLIGIDVVGIEERAEARAAILEQIKGCTVTNGKGQSEVYGETESKRQVDDIDVAEPMLPHHRPNGTTVPVPTNGDVYGDRTNVVNGGKKEEPDKPKINSKGASKSDPVSLQDVFDLQYLYTLLDTSMSAVHALPELDQSVILNHVGSAIQRGKVLYGSLV